VNILNKRLPNIRIGVFGHYGNKNLGDESIIEAAIQNIRKKMPSVEIIGFSINPKDTSQRYNIPAFLIRQPKIAHSRVSSNHPPLKSEKSNTHIDPSDRHIKNRLSTFKNMVKGLPILAGCSRAARSLIAMPKRLVGEIRFISNAYRILKDIDILMITGSNQFLDNFGGPWAFPYTLLKWSALAKLAGSKVTFVSVGAGPISHRLSTIFIRWALRFSDYASLRDAGSQSLIQKCGYKGHTHIYPDIAHSLKIDHIRPHQLTFVQESNRLPIVGINPMPLYDSRYWCVHNEKKYNVYLNKLVQFSNRLLAEKYPIFFFATQEKDNNVIDDILPLLDPEHMQARPVESLVLYSQTVDELMTNIFSADIVVATRFHGTVLSLLAEKPLVGICYYRKARELMIDMEQGEYAVDLDTFSVEDLWKRFKMLEANRAAEKELIRKYNSAYSSFLNQQYDILCGATDQETIF
jgi:polysaccharide pyruvyl transferase WcaK-like protein